METYRIPDYGVKADVEFLQTGEIQAVLDLRRDNGGKVIIPAGVFSG